MRKINRYLRLISILFTCLVILIACTDNDENENDNNHLEEIEENELENNNNDNNSKDLDEDLDETNDDGKEDKDVAALADEDHYIDGKVFILENENLIRVEAETNLVEGTRVKALLRKAYGMVVTSLKSKKVGSISGKVDSDGNVTIDIEVDEHFFEEHNGLFAEVGLAVPPSEHANLYPEIYEAYGPNGEKFKGPLVYQHELLGQHQQRLETLVVMKVGDEQIEYDLEAPVKEPLPDDYGSADIWIEADVVDNDHRFLYVEGKSNMLEGVHLSSGYFADEDQLYPDGDGFHRPKVNVEPDGTFFLPVLYDSLTDEGYIRIHSAPIRGHRIKDFIYDEYGDKFEKLSGDVVIEKDDEKEIELILKAEGIGIDAPKDSMITEEDGELKINMPDDVLFDFDKSDLKSSAKETLDEAIAILEDLDDGKEIRINGHTDSEGEHDYNMDLSEKRAVSVEKYIIANGNVDHLDIVTEGFGPTEPIASNEEEEGREKNRRVDIAFDEND